MSLLFARFLSISLFIVRALSLHLSPTETFSHLVYSHCLLLYNPLRHSKRWRKVVTHRSTHRESSTSVNSRTDSHTNGNGPPVLGVRFDFNVTLWDIHVFLITLRLDLSSTYKRKSAILYHVHFTIDYPYEFDPMTLPHRLSAPQKSCPTTNRLPYKPYKRLHARICEQCRNFFSIC